MAARAGSVAVATAALSFTTLAHAEADAGADIGALEQQLNEQVRHLPLGQPGALGSSDCAAACRALGSIQRAAEKICKLEPGPRCDAARARAADASRRVREACPDCAIASTLPPSDDRAMATPAPAPEQSNAPLAERERGGCRSCTIEGAPNPQDLGLLALAVVAGLRVLGRRRRR